MQKEYLDTFRATINRASSVIQRSILSAPDISLSHDSCIFSLHKSTYTNIAHSDLFKNVILKKTAFDALAHTQKEQALVENTELHNLTIHFTDTVTIESSRYTRAVITFIFTNKQGFMLPQKWMVYFKESLLTESNIRPNKTAAYKIFFKEHPVQKQRKGEACNRVFNASENSGLLPQSEHSILEIDDDPAENPDLHNDNASNEPQDPVTDYTDNTVFSYKPPLPADEAPLNKSHQNAGSQEKKDLSAVLQNQTDTIIQSGTYNPFMNMNSTPNTVASGDNPFSNVEPGDNDSLENIFFKKKKP